MPYAVRKQGNKWITVNLDTGDVKGTHDTKEKAVEQMRLLYGVDHGMKPRTFSKGALERAREKS